MRSKPGHVVASTVIDNTTGSFSRELDLPGPPAGSVWVPKALTIAPAVDSTFPLVNLVPNPSFEVNLNGIITTGGFYTNSGGVTYNRVPGAAGPMTGAWVVDAVTDGTIDQQGPRIDVAAAFQPGMVVQISAYVKIISGRPVRLAVRDTTNAVSAVTGFTSAASFVRLSTSMVIGALGTPLISVYLPTDFVPAISEYQFDAIQVVVAPTLPPYADVSLPGAFAAIYMGQSTANVRNTFDLFNLLMPPIGGSNGIPFFYSLDDSDLTMAYGETMSIRLGGAVPDESFTAILRYLEQPEGRRLNIL